tara:strand:- start:76 stop:939 length:864 start_codon:yes stop_codon:yes gene_type:complete
MFKKLSYLLFGLIKLFDKFIKLIFKKNFLLHFKDYVEKDLYCEIKILDNKIKFFTPNQLVDWRVKTFFFKEPETIEWIDNFKNNENPIFWDIGANIGLFSIYNAIKNPNSTTFSFEPSTSNLRTLSRNISINKLEKSIKILPFPLSNKENIHLEMKEENFIEGGALNTFGENYDFEGKNFEGENRYQLFGTTIDFLIKQQILKVPDYIKIDVDGIEHLILEGASNCLKEKKIKSISVEINENFKDQHDKILKIMELHNFKLLSKKNNNKFFDKKSKFSKIFNYVFVR